MLRPIIKYGGSVLHQPATDVDAITNETQDLIDDMIETMYAAPGVGLAAPQVGCRGASSSSISASARRPAI